MELTKAERDQLAATLGCQLREVEERLRHYSEAATEEYVRMILGQKVFTRGSDVREYRLLLLIQNVFQQLPSEQQISALFQTSATQSRGLLRAVMSKYQYELSQIIRNSLKTALEATLQDPNGKGRLLTVDSENVVEALNREIVAIDGTLQPVSKARGTAST